MSAITIEEQQYKNWKWLVENNYIPHNRTYEEYKKQCEDRDFSGGVIGQIGPPASSIEKGSYISS